MADEIEEAAAVRRRTGAEPLGVAKILAQDPETRPQRVKKSPAPLLHAASKEIRQIFYEGFALFVAAYRVATEKLLKGDPNPVSRWAASHPRCRSWAAGRSRSAGSV